MTFSSPSSLVQTSKRSEFLWVLFRFLLSLSSFCFSSSMSFSLLPIFLRPRRAWAKFWVKTFLPFAVDTVNVCWSDHKCIKRDIMGNNCKQIKNGKQSEILESNCLSFLRKRSCAWKWECFRVHISLRSLVVFCCCFYWIQRSNKKRKIVNGQRQQRWRSRRRNENSCTDAK